MSWISDFAGKAEDLLNRIDNNAASVLNTKEKKKRSAVAETSNVDNPEAQLQIVTSSTPPVTPLGGTGTPRTSLTPKKTKEMSLASSAVQDPLIDLSQDEKLITFLNNPSVVVEDLEVKVDRSESKSALSSPKKFLYSSLDPGLLQNENEMLTNEVRSLNVEVSLLLGRVKSAEADSLSWRALLTKKDAELNILKNDLASLQQQIKDIQKNNENGFLENERLKKNYKSRNEQTRELEEKLSDLQLEMHKREELFKSDLANMRIRVTELEELMSTSNAQHVKQMSESKIRFEEMRTQFEDYKARARKTLTDKDALIQELKTGNQPSQSESLEISQLRNELEVISGELEKCESRVELERKRAEETADRLELLREESAAEVNSVRSQLRQEAERRLAAEENCRQHAEELHKVREDLNKELSVMSDRLREKLNEVASLRRQITQRSDSKPNLSEAKVSTLTQALVQKQTALEAMTNDRNQIRLEMERLKNMYGQCVNHTAVRSNVNDTDDAKAQVPTFMLESPFDTGVARKVKRAYSSLDAVSIRTGMFLRRYPFARILVLCYCICLHLWVCLVLFSNTPDTKI